MQTTERLIPDPAKGRNVRTIRFVNTGFEFGKLALHVLNRAWLNHARRKLMLGAEGFAKSMREKRDSRNPRSAQIRQPERD